MRASIRITATSAVDAPGDHVARVLLVSRRVGDDELAPVGGEEAIRNVDGDALLTFGGQAVDEQREIEIAALRADFFRVGFERLELVFEDELRLVQQPADQRGLAVIDAAAGDEPQQALVLVRLQVSLNVGRDEIGFVRHEKRDIGVSRKKAQKAHNGMNAFERCTGLAALPFLRL